MKTVFGIIGLSILWGICVTPLLGLNAVADTFLQPSISIEEAVEQQKSTIFDASQSFIPDPTQKIKYEWDFGDGNKNEGIEVLHVYKEPGEYAVTLTISDETNSESVSSEIFVYKKLILLITDKSEEKETIEINKDIAKKEGVFMKVIESFGSSTEFISEEVLNKKLTEESDSVQKADQILIWTKGNAGLNALSRFLQGNQKINLSQKSITIIQNSVSENLSRIQKQFELVNPKIIITIQEGALFPVIESEDDETLLEILKTEGHKFDTITAKTGKVRPWNFMSYFVNFLINEGIPDNTIALLLLLPVIATVVAFMKQVIGMTTFGIYTPSIITLSFLIIGIYAGLLTLIIVMIIGAATRPLLGKIRMLYIPKMALIITLVSLALLLILGASNYLGFFDAEFLSIAIFPMLILSTLVEKFISVKTEKGFSSATFLMLSTVLVAIIAYVIAGGAINFGVTSIQFDTVKRMMINYPEIVIVILLVNFLLGKWTGLRILERVRFREILRHIEE